MEDPTIKMKTISSKMKEWGYSKSAVESFLKLVSAIRLRSELERALEKQPFACESMRAAGDIFISVSSTGPYGISIVVNPDYARYSLDAHSLLQSLMWEVGDPSDKFPTLGWKPTSDAFMAQLSRLNNARRFGPKPGEADAILLKSGYDPHQSAVSRKIDELLWGLGKSALDKVQSYIATRELWQEVVAKHCPLLAEENYHEKLNYYEPIPLYFFDWTQPFTEGFLADRLEQRLASSQGIYRFSESRWGLLAAGVYAKNGCSTDVARAILRKVFFEELIKRHTDLTKDDLEGIPTKFDPDRDIHETYAGSGRVPIRDKFVITYKPSAIVDFKPGDETYDVAASLVDRVLQKEEVGQQGIIRAC